MRHPSIIVHSALLLLTIFCFRMAIGDSIDEKESKLPTKCHVCKHLVREIRDELTESGKTHDVLQIGQPFQGGVKKIPYSQSETRLTEAIENACSNVLEYKVHKDKPDALRYEKVESVTFKTLKRLRKRGVKVELGFPDEMWDSPDAEVTRLKNRCEFMVEKYEDEISEWYWKHQHENLTEWLCVERVLDSSENECLNETKAWDEVKEKEKREKKKQSKSNKKKNSDRKKENDEKQEKEKLKMGKTSKQKGNFDVHDKDADDTAKIQRLIREQAEEQARGHYNGRSSATFSSQRISTLSEKKRRKLRRRLLDAGEDGDSLHILREIHKIRQIELNEDEIGYMRDPLVDDVADRIPEEVMRNLGKRKLEHLDNADDLRRELRLLGDINNVGDPDEFRVRKMRLSLVEDANNLKDVEELRERIKDLEAFSAIFDTKNDDSGGDDNGDDLISRRHHRYHNDFNKEKPRDRYGDEL